MRVKVNDSVKHRQSTTRDTVIRYGRVISVNKDKALCHFPADRARANVPISELEVVSQFGNTRLKQVIGR